MLSLMNEWMGSTIAMIHNSTTLAWLKMVPPFKCLRMLNTNAAISPAIMRIRIRLMINMVNLLPMLGEPQLITPLPLPVVKTK